MGTTAIAANGRVDRNVMPAVHIYAPPATHRFVLAKTCPDCGKRTRMLGWAYEWHGATVVCLRCGREWQGGEWMPLPFMRGARQHNINEAKARWRRGSRHNALVQGRAACGESLGAGGSAANDKEKANGEQREWIVRGEAMPYYTAQPGESATIRAQVAPGRWEDVPRRSEANK